MLNDINITQNTEENCFETSINGHKGFISYQDQGDTIVYDHTIVDPELGGKGVGSALVKHALDYARSENKKVVPECSFVASYINKHEEYQDLVK